MLSLEMRPATWADVVGQKHVVPVLRIMSRDRTAPASLVFSGPRGSGKTSSARIMAAALNCEKAPEQEGSPCNECASCQSVRDGNSFAVTEIDAASHGLVDDIRSLTESVSYDHGDGWRIVMLDEAHSMSGPAWNALLKTLEEPPERTCFILLTTEIGKVPDTVLSRSMVFEFRRLALEDIVTRLGEVSADRQMGFDESMTRDIARRARGGMRDALMLMEQAHRAGVSDVSGLREMVGDPDVSSRLVEAAADGNLAEAHACVDEHFRRTGDGSLLTSDLVAVLKDLLVLKAGGEPKGLSDADLEARRALAARCSEASLVGAIKVLWEMRSRARPSEWDQRAVADMGVVLMVEAMGKSFEADTKDEPTNGSARLTLGRMSEIVRKS